MGAPAGVPWLIAGELHFRLKTLLVAFTKSSGRETACHRFLVRRLRKTVSTWLSKFHSQSCNDQPFFTAKQWFLFKENKSVSAADVIPRSLKKLKPVVPWECVALPPEKCSKLRVTQTFVTAEAGCN